LRLIKTVLGRMWRRIVRGFGFGRILKSGAKGMQ
jgi:hypothetical protein